MTTKTYNGYYAGAVVRLTGEFRNETDELADPSTVSVQLRMKDGSVETPAVVKDSVGQYHSDIDTGGFDNGIYPYKWVGTGAVAAADEWAFEILYDKVVPV